MYVIYNKKIDLRMSRNTGWVRGKGGRCCAKDALFTAEIGIQGGFPGGAGVKNPTAVGVQRQAKTSPGLGGSSGAKCSHSSTFTWRSMDRGAHTSGCNPWSHRWNATDTVVPWLSVL